MKNHDKLKGRVRRNSNSGIQRGEPIKNHRYTPLDYLMREIEADYLRGRIGITPQGEIAPLQDIYEDLPPKPNRHADYHIAPPQDRYREQQSHCRYCQTAYRHSDQRDPDRCPFCWHLI